MDKPLATVLDIPFELLSETFVIFVSNGGSPWILAQICRSWRTCAFGTSKLWSSLSLQLPGIAECRYYGGREQCSSIPGLLESLDRAGYAPLDVHIAYDVQPMVKMGSESVAGSLLEIICKRSEHWDQITYGIGPWPPLIPCKWVEMMKEVSAPRLKKISFTAASRAHGTWNPLLYLPASMPALRKAKLEFHTVLNTVNISPVDWWVKIKHLHLRGAIIENQHVLQTCRALVKLRLYRCRLTSTLGADTWPKLRYLNVEYCLLNFPATSFPDLTHLIITSNASLSTNSLHFPVLTLLQVCWYAPIDFKRLYTPRLKKFILEAKVNAGPIAMNDLLCQIWSEDNPNLAAYQKLTTFRLFTYWTASAIPIETVKTILLKMPRLLHLRLGSEPGFIKEFCQWLLEEKPLQTLTDLRLRLISPENDSLDDILTKVQNTFPQFKFRWSFNATIQHW